MIAIDRKSVIDVAVVGAMGILRTKQRVYVVRLDWYPRVDLALAKQMLRAGQTQHEIASFFEVAPSVVSKAICADGELMRKYRKKATA